jgi:hypothetical protein
VQKALPRGALVRPFGAHVSDQRVLVVRMSRRLDTQQLARPGFDTIGAEDQLAAQFAPIGQGYADIGFAAGNGSDARFDQHGTGRMRALQALRLQRAPLDDGAEIWLADLGTVKTQ